MEHIAAFSTGISFAALVFSAVVARAVFKNNKRPAGIDGIPFQIKPGFWYIPAGIVLDFLKKDGEKVRIDTRDMAAVIWEVGNDPPEQLSFQKTP